MRPIDELPLEAARDIDVVFTDIDDTLTTGGRIPAAAFSAVWALAEAGVDVVPVTGRPAGWCDHLARMWPVAGIIGENGAFYFRYEPEARRLVRRFVLSEEARYDLARRLEAIKDEVLARVPRARVAADQPYRIHDLAIDFAEDIGPLDAEEIDRIVQIFVAAGATAKVSSIHVNGWFGAYDKLTMIRCFAEEALGFSLDGAEAARALYVGDSPNDEPAFAFFPCSVGVANVRALAARMTHLPTYVTKRSGGEGFAELTARLLEARLAGRAPSA